MTMSQSINVVYPPLRDPSEIPFLLSSCIASARSSGIDIHLLDFNQNFWEYVLDLEEVKSRYKTLEGDWNYWSEQQEIPPNKIEYVYGLLKAFLRREHVENKLVEAVKMMKSSEDLNKREEARTVIRYALELFQLPYTPTQLALNDANLMFSTESTEQLYKSIEHPSNPFYHFLMSMIEESATEWIIWVEADQQLIPTYTLTYLIHKKYPNINISWAGPFFAEFGANLITRPPSFIDKVVAVTHPNDFIQSLSSVRRINNPVIKWGYDDLKISDYWTPYDDIRLRKEWINDLSFCAWLTGEPSPTIRFYLYQPTTAIDALKWGEILERFRWGFYLKFDQFLSGDDIDLLKSKGVEWIHWELKGWLATDSVDVVKENMLQTWRACKEANIPVYHSIVLGYPLSSPEDFRAFITFLSDHQEWVDRNIRFKLFRLYENSPFWNRPKDYGITWISEQKPSMDLQRGFPFRTYTGWDSEHFYTLATSLVSQVQRKTRKDFPRDVLAVDDTKLYLSNTKEEEDVQEINMDDHIKVVLSSKIQNVTLPFSPTDLEKGVQLTVPGQEKTYSSDPVIQKEVNVLYDLEKDRFILINSAVSTVLRTCDHAIEIGDLLKRFPKKQHASVRQLVKKLRQGGILIEQARRTIST